MLNKKTIVSQTVISILVLFPVQNEQVSEMFASLSEALWVDWETKWGRADSVITQRGNALSSSLQIATFCCHILALGIYKLSEALWVDWETKWGRADSVIMAKPCQLL